MKKFIYNLLGRKFTYRIGRSMYMFSRGDIPNDMNTNGELMVQDIFINYVLKNKGKKYIVFDVGANVGDWSVSLSSKVIKNEIKDIISIYSFEPVESTFNLLKSNMPQSSSYILVNKALSSNNGITEIFITEKNSGTNSLYDETSGVNKVRSFSIDLVTAKDFCLDNSIDRIDLVKCDTEGHDFEVIKGANSLFSNSKIGIFQFEYNHRWIFSRNVLRDVFLMFEKLPYKIAKLQSNKILIYNSWHPELDRYFEANFLIIHESLIEEFNSEIVSFDKANTPVYNFV